MDWFLYDTSPTKRYFQRGYINPPITHQLSQYNDKKKKKKAYHMILHSRILETLELVQVSENIVEFIRKSMKNWNTNLTSCGEYLANVNIRRGIFQGDSLSPLLLVICHDIE